MSAGRLPLTIPVKPWFSDHCFAGKTVLPAVETMLLLAARVAELSAEIDIQVMENVSFAKFLEIPDTTATMTGLVECETISDGRLEIKLLSRTQCKAMSRIKEHGSIVFSPAKSHGSRPLTIDLTQLTEPMAEIKVEYLYRELVPFGPHYQTLKESLYLSGLEAWGKLKAPDVAKDPVQEIIGSPFPLDGAFHAACVLGQQSVSFVPFPVGFDRRVISRPTQPGCAYRTKVRQVQQTEDELVFDLVIFDDAGTVYETVTGLRMRDVSGAMRR
jgi:hypothetical protein